MNVLGKAVISIVLLSVAIVAFVFVGLALEPLFGWGIAPVLIIVGTVLVIVVGKMDPENPMKVVLDQTGSWEDESNMPSYGGSDWTDEDYRLLTEKGIQGLETLLEVLDIGKSQDFSPVARVSWIVQVPGMSPYKVSREIPIPTESVRQLRGVVGKTFSARVHPSDREKIIVDVRFQ